MAVSGGPKRRKSGTEGLPRGLIQRGAAYIAKLVSPRELWEFVQANGGGDLAVAWVAARQLGLITTSQLEALGIGPGLIAVRLNRGTLHRVHRGVYLVGHSVLLPGALELAGVLACGPGSVVSHGSAAALWGLAPHPADEVRVTVVGRDRRSRPGLSVHRVRHLDPRDRGHRNGIPVTAPARSLLDFAADAGSDELERAIAEARARDLLSDSELRAAIGRAPQRAGAGRLRAELERERGPQWTQSEGERRTLRLLREARLPQPLTNVRVEGWPVDFLWPEHKLIVEVDGYAFHSHRRAFERDRRRDAAHVSAGYVVIRITWRQLKEEPLVVVATIARALGRSSSRAAY
jgi:very-short-patch-repair endonuclease